MKNVFIVPDMSCEHCKKTITSALKKINGIKDVIIDLNTKRVEIIGEVEEDKIISAIEDAGYTVEDKTDS